MADSADQPICRICTLDGTANEPLYYPCKCKGTIGYMHNDCLCMWLNSKPHAKCEICQHPFQFRPKFSKDLPRTGLVKLLDLFEDAKLWMPDIDKLVNVLVSLLMHFTLLPYLLGRSHEILIFSTSTLVQWWYLNGATYCRYLDIEPLLYHGLLVSLPQGHFFTNVMEGIFIIYGTFLPIMSAIFYYRWQLLTGRDVDLFGVTLLPGPHGRGRDRNIRRVVYRILNLSEREVVVAVVSERTRQAREHRLILDERLRMIGNHFYHNHVLQANLHLLAYVYREDPSFDLIREVDLEIKARHRALQEFRDAMLETGPIYFWDRNLRSSDRPAINRFFAALDDDLRPLIHIPPGLAGSILRICCSSLVIIIVCFALNIIPCCAVNFFLQYFAESIHLCRAEFAHLDFAVPPSNLSGSDEVCAPAAAVIGLDSFTRMMIGVFLYVLVTAIPIYKAIMVQYSKLQDNQWIRKVFSKLTSGLLVWFTLYCAVPVLIGGPPTLLRLILSNRFVSQKRGYSLLIDLYLADPWILLESWTTGMMGLYKFRHQLATFARAFIKLPMHVILDKFEMEELFFPPLFPPLLSHKLRKCWYKFMDRAIGTRTTVFRSGNTVVNDTGVSPDLVQMDLWAVLTFASYLTGSVWLHAFPILLTKHIFGHLPGFNAVPAYFLQVVGLFLMSLLEPHLARIELKLRRARRRPLIETVLGVGLPLLMIMMEVRVLPAMLALMTKSVLVEDVMRTFMPSSTYIRAVWILEIVLHGLWIAVTLAKRDWIPKQRMLLIFTVRGNLGGFMHCIVNVIGPLCFGLGIVAYTVDFDVWAIFKAAWLMEVCLFGFLWSLVILEYVLFYFWNKRIKLKKYFIGFEPVNCPRESMWD